MSTRPIGDHALLSDCRSAALVTSDGSVDWLCFPRFDSPAVFARLLDEDAGHWSIRPAGPAEATRRYLEDSLVLETTFRNQDGTVVLLDALALGGRERGHSLGASSPGVLLREVTCVEGSVPLEMTYAPRPEFGLVHPLMEPVRGGLVARGGAHVLTLSAPVDLTVSDSTARAAVTLRAGQRLCLALQASWGWAPEPPRRHPWRVHRRLKDTVAGWRSWSRLHTGYRGPWQEQVGQSGRVLRALTFSPTGAIVAAATTSLPESVGGERNWDYRYTWIRDTSFTLQALATATCELEEASFFSFLARAAATELDRGVDLQIMYGVGGERDLSERLLPHLDGWRGSAPVRVGNDAWRQRQIDVYGELLDAAWQLYGDAGRLDRLTRSFLVGVAETAARRWQEPDQSLWEVRGPSRHYVHSKLMCWVALDRAVALAPTLGATGRVAEWERTRERIRAEILARGWSERVGAFTQTFETDDLDASVLMMPLVGFLPGDDPRVRATVEAVAAHLTDARGLVHRYHSADGLPGGEGTFLLCTFWLAHALALAGRGGPARKAFETAASYANDVGLLAEEVDSVTGEPIGNFPQAFSHIGLINAARAIRDTGG
ncbi:MULTISPECIES: glycoside hydrolase family 15 protein [Streptosporangium]|uniref:GH15 family glucan-1,4-alpha-glucosidase n=1 Tax=Streptosporangium brasiliense TaxID=47480 RepID=A0ABT9RA96_9ACTN|nr:glycoside hydrolase family 15 protein [Streptosporangium brasiliense]MDP9865776.1 GH15 family glucan-1,4-alpha-glucosidase [Streptosporangium brasiliense]